MRGPADEAGNAMCAMMAGNALDWRWVLQGGPITWLVVLFAVLAVVGVILAGAALARKLVDVLGSPRRSPEALARPNPGFGGEVPDRPTPPSAPEQRRPSDNTGV
ncbi:hypothetical protein [Methylobacterium oxalidis]|uniref:hypothetical protein n=1 Tax=Methylobacterium oxalidis TaxID=944322 RepID=UPI0033154498